MFIRLSENEISAMTPMTGKYAHHLPPRCAEYSIAQFIIRPSVGTSVVLGPRPSSDSCASDRIAELICRMNAMTT